MKPGLEMKSGPGLSKPVIIGVIVIAAGAAAYFKMSSGDKKSVAEPTQASEPLTQVAGAAAATNPVAVDDGGPLMPIDSAAGTSVPKNRTLGDGSLAGTTAVAAKPAAPAAAPAETPAPEVAETAPAAAPEMKPEPEPAPEPAAAEAPAMTAEPVEAPSAPQETAATAPVESASATPKKATRKQPPKPAAAEELRPWWNVTAGNPLAVESVGQLTNGKALVMRFNQEVAPSAATQNVRVYNIKGKPVQTAWQVGETPQVLVLPGLAKGRYTLVVSGALASTQGQALGREIHGPAYIE